MSDRRQVRLVRLSVVRLVRPSSDRLNWSFCHLAPSSELDPSDLSSSSQARVRPGSDQARQLVPYCRPVNSSVPQDWRQVRSGAGTSVRCPGQTGQVRPGSNKLSDQCRPVQADRPDQYQSDHLSGQSKPTQVVGSGPGRRAVRSGRQGQTGPSSGQVRPVRLVRTQVVVLSSSSSSDQPGQCSQSFASAAAVLPIAAAAIVLPPLLLPLLFCNCIAVGYLLLLLFYYYCRFIAAVLLLYIY